MKQSIILSTFGPAIMAAAHGIVSQLKIGDDLHAGYNPFQDPYMSPAPQRIVWDFPSAGNGPVENVASSDITCNIGATAAPISAKADAGDDVTFFWTEWPESHRGPVMTYLANCGGDCSSVDPTTLSYFKIDHAGLNADGSWASDDVIANNNSWTVTLPSDITAGNYILRHELLALHSAHQENGAQFYPMCANLEISSSGSANPAGVKFPGAYKSTDPGIFVDIYNGLTSYAIPGPDVYTSGSSGSKPASSSSIAAVKTSSAAAPITTSAVITSAAPVVTSAVVSSAAPITTSAVIAPPAPISSSSPSSAASTTRVPTTLVTRTTSKASAPTGSKKTMNTCLDEVNACIRSKQSKTGGAVDFSSCEAQRANCYSGSF